MSFFYSYFKSVVKKAGGTTEPNPYAVLSVGNTKFISGIKSNTPNPHWDENYFFVIENPEHEALLLQIFDKKTEKRISSLEFNLCELLEQNNLCLNQEFSLNCQEYLVTKPKLTMKLTLKVIFNHVFENY